MGPRLCENEVKNCVLLPALGKQNATLPPNFTQAGAHLLVHPCTCYLPKSYVALRLHQFWKLSDDFSSLLCRGVWAEKEGGSQEGANVQHIDEGAHEIIHALVQPEPWPSSARGQDKLRSGQGTCLFHHKGGSQHFEHNTINLCFYPTIHHLWLPLPKIPSTLLCKFCYQKTEYLTLKNCMAVRGILSKYAQNYAVFVLLMQIEMPTTCADFQRKGSS